MKFPAEVADNKVLRVTFRGTRLHNKYCYAMFDCGVALLARPKQMDWKLRISFLRLNMILE